LITVSALIREKMLVETALVFIFGLLWGSFANVVISRYPKGESVVLPRSRCPQCKNPIAWYDNIPVISWLVLRGRCRKCGGHISWRYPLVELLIGCLFAVVFHCVTLGAPSHVFLRGS
jgi:leader peptidase (prepilin peptidase)/N-methyltransferase